MGCETIDYARAATRVILSTRPSCSSFQSTTSLQSTTSKEGKEGRLDRLAALGSRPDTAGGQRGERLDNPRLPADKAFV